MNVYFVCTGNTCRSPMAAAILQSKNLPNIEVKSAGVYALDGGEMSENAQTVLNEQGILHQHQSAQVTEENLKWAHLILTMTRAHKEMILRSYPQFADKTFTLKEYVTPYTSLDVSDPFGGDVQIYRQTYEELTKLIDQFEQRIKEEIE
ncbi:MAG: low molecular weight protein arginine phosphatase [Lysinibacillus sp.]